MQCRTQSYVGPDPYRFTPAGSPRRPYRCRDQAGVRPVWHLIGYFGLSACVPGDLCRELELYPLRPICADPHPHRRALPLPGVEHPSRGSP